MILIDYKLSDPWMQQTHESLHTADEDDFRYEYFPGSVIFKDGDNDFSAMWDWIPVVDFAACLKRICDSLSAGSVKEKFEYTESDAAINFEFVDGLLQISTNYKPGQIKISLKEFTVAVNQFCQRIAMEFGEQNPELLRSGVFRALLSMD